MPLNFLHFLCFLLIAIFVVTKQKLITSYFCSRSGQFCWVKSICWHFIGVARCKVSHSSYHYRYKHCWGQAPFCHIISSAGEISLCLGRLLLVTLEPRVSYYPQNCSNTRVIRNKFWKGQFTGRGTQMNWRCSPAALLSANHSNL